MPRKLEKKAVSASRDRVNHDKAAIFCNVTSFFSVLIDEGKLKLRENAGILAARACGLAYSTYRRYLGGKTELPAPDNVKNKRKERRDTTKIDPDLYAKIRDQIRRWNDGFDCQDVLYCYSAGCCTDCEMVAEGS